MTATLAIARRELDAWFASPLGWLFLCGFIALSGLFFVFSVLGYAMQSTSAAMNPYMADAMDINTSLLPEFFGNTAVVLLLILPALTMRLFAEDRRQRSFELLLSSPITSAQIVMGKYLGALGYLAVMLGATLHFPAILYWLGSPDTGILVANYASIFLLSAAFLAVGMFASSFTEHQVVALIVGFGLLLILWILSWIDFLSEAPWATAASYISMLSHQSDLAKGLVHLKDLVYYVTFVGFFLFATQQRVEAYRWQ